MQAELDLFSIITAMRNIFDLCENHFHLLINKYIPYFFAENENRVVNNIQKLSAMIQ